MYAPSRAVARSTGRANTTLRTVPVVPRRRGCKAAVMRKQILLISGHPDADPKRYLHALMQAYAEGARGAGHSVRIIEVARIVFRPLSTAEDFAHGKAPPDIVAAQRLVRWADHVVFL
ncbi:MAG: hypothetical protein EOP18_01980, partial [Rhizobiaceae bacterium]